jgi:hypothetical protein
MYRYAATLIALTGLLTILGIYACSSGSGGGSANISSEDVSYGRVGILLADAPADEYEHIWITITDVTLIPSDGGEGITVFTSAEGYQLDLLALRDENFLLTLNEQIPAGTYAKVRVGVSAIVPEPRMGSTACADWDVKLPSGKIDFIPQGGVQIEPGETVYVKLDIDANKSIQLHEAGSSGKCIFRPVVFVDVMHGETICFWRHPYRGTISELLANTEGATTGFVMDRDHSCLGTLEVRLAEDTIIFTADGVFGTPADLATAQDVLVRGVMDSEGVLNAKAVIIGDAMVLKGSVADALAAGDNDTQVFNLTLNSGQEMIGTLPVIIYPQTVIRSGCDTEETIDGLTVGTPLVVIGKYDATNNVFKTAGILILPLPEA